MEERAETWTLRSARCAWSARRWGGLCDHHGLPGPKATPASKARRSTSSSGTPAW